MAVFRSSLALLLLLACEAAAQRTGPYREWASADGKFTAQARLLDHTDTHALLLRDGKHVPAPIAKLSDDDRAFIQSDNRKLIVGEVIRIADGDTLTVRAGEENHRIRFNGIDAPESGQDYGNRAKQALAKLAHRKTARVRWTEEDRYGRVLGDVIVGGEWLNLRLVRDGWAWRYVKYSDDSDLIAAEKQAREAKGGLWADPNAPLPPWEYRQRGAERRQQAATGLLGTEQAPRAPPAPVTEAAAEQSYWLNTSSNVRHNRSCRYYANTKRGRKCSASEGKPCGICGG